MPELFTIRMLFFIILPISKPKTINRPPWCTQLFTQDQSGPWRMRFSICANPIRHHLPGLTLTDGLDGCSLSKALDCWVEMRFLDCNIAATHGLTDWNQTNQPSDRPTARMVEANQYKNLQFIDYRCSGLTLLGSNRLPVYLATYLQAMQCVRVCRWWLHFRVLGGGGCEIQRQRWHHRRQQIFDSSCGGMVWQLCEMRSAPRKICTHWLSWTYSEIDRSFVFLLRFH